MDDSEISPYRQTLFSISRGLTDDEVGELKFLCKDRLTVSQKEGIKNARDLFDVLEKMGIISEDNFNFLIEIMDHLQCQVLKKKLLDLRKMLGHSVEMEDESPSPPTASSRLGAGAGRTPTSSNAGPKGGVTIRNSPITLGSSIGNTYNYGHSTRTQDGFASPPAAGLGTQSTPGGSDARPVGGATITNSPLTFGNSFRNTYNYGSKKSPPTASSHFQSQGMEPKAGHSTGHRQDTSPALSFSSWQTRTSSSSPLNPGVLKTPADFSLHVPKARPAEAAMDVDPADGSSYVINPPDDSQDIHAPLTDSAAPKSPLLNATPSPSKTKLKKARINEKPILDWPNIMTPQPSESRAGDEGCLLRPVSNPDASPQVEFQSKGDVETDAPGQAELFKAPACDVSSNGAQLESLISLLSQNGDVVNGNKELDKIGHGVQDTQANGDETTKVVLRDYQKELAHYPLMTGGNYIICAPTGSGKTLTAASICYKKYEEFQANPTPGKHFKALFIVNIRHLTQQQSNAFQEYFPDSLAVRTIGDQQPFEYALMKDKPMPVVLMLTAQIFVNALRQKIVSLQDLDVLIFDECHHTDLLHPYNVIMKMYLKEKTAASQGVGEHVGSLPQVIGLSASLGVGHSQVALSHILKLCANMDVRDVIRVRDRRNKKQLDQFVKAPEQDDVISVPPRAPAERHFGSLLEMIMGKIEDQLGETAKISLPRHGCQPYENEVVARQEKSPEHKHIVVYKYLNAYNRALMLYEDLPVQDCLRTLEEFYESRSVCQNEAYTPEEKICRDLFDRNLAEMERAAREEGDGNPKLQQLIKLLADQFTLNPSSKGIILNRMKVATVALCEFIRSCPCLNQLPCPVRPERLVGQGALDEYCMTESQQKMILESFRQEDGCNVLVATDIAQEGLDMPACNFVIRYNFVSNEIGTVQSKGRARAEGSKCYLIVESGSTNEQRELENRDKVKSMEKAMKELEAMPQEERLRCIQEKQREVIAAMQEAEHRQQQLAAQMKGQQILLKCAECKQPVCYSSDLRRKGAGGYVTCINPEFEDRVTEMTLEKPATRFRDSQSVCKIMCGTRTCKNQFGTRETFFISSDESLGFSLRAKSFIAQYGCGGEKRLKKWKELAIVDDADL
ncbi:probable ATP-dependent RNA helicase DHX58 [Acanthaster planci]|uniref:RNA helicase n=1 Tax=Acanthaster planci TaxID=133434 RepID=A0A8B7YWI3_ACAPL|nr:probable ATP-dependent RNA helicase DHX58 [Acanthaster planci]XP_022096857.1 probable ATP-dependent RNA helicase DHX58 [Acanthaster planci]